MLISLMIDMATPLKKLAPPFLSNVPILYPLKTNQRFSDVFTGYKIGTLARNGLI